MKTVYLAGLHHGVYPIFRSVYFADWFIGLDQYDSLINTISEQKTVLPSASLPRTFFNLLSLIKVIANSVYANPEMEQNQSGIVRLNYGMTCPVRSGQAKLGCHQRGA